MAASGLMGTFPPYRARRQKRLDTPNAKIRPPWCARPADRWRSIVLNTDEGVLDVQAVAGEGCPRRRGGRDPDADNIRRTGMAAVRAGPLNVATRRTKAPTANCRWRPGRPRAPAHTHRQLLATTGRAPRPIRTQSPRPRAPRRRRGRRTPAMSIATLSRRRPSSLVASGELPVRRLGGRVYVVTAELRELVAS